MNHTSSNIEIDRPLTSEEHSVVQWLLEHGEADNAKFLEQLEQARVASLCGCGCASIDFAVGGKRPIHPAIRTLSDYQWRDAHGHLFGAYVFEQDGKQLLDSLITENKVLEGDSITVKRIPENPERSKIEFYK